MTLRVAGAEGMAARDCRATGLSLLLKQHPYCLSHGKGGSIRLNGISGAGGIRKRTAFPPPLRGAATKTIAIRTNEGQRPARRGRSARLGRGGRWPEALAPGWRVAPVPQDRGDGPGQNVRGTLSRFPVWQPPVFPVFQRPDGPAGPVGLLLFTDPQQVQAWD